jgi:Protein of unknown function (DUF2924).
MKKKALKILRPQKGLPKDLTKKAVASVAAGKKPAFAALSAKPRDSRIPSVGTIITKKYKGEALEVKVLDNGFEYKGQVFKSISALAVHIVGAPISGYVFFKL